MMRVATRECRKNTHTYIYIYIRTYFLLGQINPTS
jgi:hypothetical protein